MTSPESSESSQPLEPLPPEGPLRNTRGLGTALVVGVIVIVIGLVTVIGVVLHGNDPSAEDGSMNDVANGPLLANVQTYPETRNHVQGKVAYAQTPPAGGDHNPVWLNCGIYDFQVPNENAVHSMEHGAVWITYDPARVSQADIGHLKSVANLTFVVLSPYAGLPSPVVATAWGTQLRLTGAHDPALPAFIRAYRVGPQTPEPGAPCTGGSNGRDAYAVNDKAPGPSTPGDATAAAQAGAVPGGVASMNQNGSLNP